MPNTPQLSAEEVAEFLRSQPDFFERHVDILLQLNVAHPHGGRTVSIPERQLIATREKARLLEHKLAELIHFGEENDALSEKVHALTLQLVACADYRALVDTLFLELLDRFQVPHVALRWWDVQPALAGAAEFSTVAVELRQFVEAMQVPYCGSHPVYETHLWFGEHAPHLKSYAMVPLRRSRSMGLLLMASENPTRFYADMGTVFLQRIGDTLAASAARFLEPLPAGAG